MSKKDTLGESLWNRLLQMNELRKQDPEELMRQTTEAAKTLQLLRILDQEPNKILPCPCECNQGQFCGGCGHRGCGWR